ncbi:cytokine-inducible SH2-containing protein [Nothobranchius furzeri]|uniref:Cytokine-inducible SH2-containing protein n=5 Tax=Nothobranchius TaxID=28779 RepID=A0A1A8UAD8_NOTFU|nr:cytokine-inducible SH2-containing protein [Nothobranchius furzeri]KAF7207962.1 cytokine inducible SH2-containing protein [Nothobranchius furzeri]
MILCERGPRSLNTEAPRGMREEAVAPVVPCLQSSPHIWDTVKDLTAIGLNLCYLENSGWYWGAVTATQAHAALQEAPEGTFLVRDSSHPLYMLTLTVKTARGPTSIRIQYCGTQFLLDASSPARSSLSSFPNVPSLVQHYMGAERKSEERKAKEDERHWKPTEQLVQESSVVLKLKRPAYVPWGIPSLQHLTRLVINKHTDCPDELPIPRPMQHFLKEYPFKV